MQCIKLTCSSEVLNFKVVVGIWRRSCESTRLRLAGIAKLRRPVIVGANCDWLGTKLDLKALEPMTEQQGKLVSK